jgi:plastocyanin
MIRRAAIAATLLFLLSTASVSAAASVTIQTVNTSGYNPSIATISLASTVSWQNQSVSTNHTTTSDLAGLWDLTLNHGTTTVDLAFDNAGSFAYHCKIHGNMRGTVQVKMAASPTSATLGSQFDIVWATAVAPTGYVFDVQRKRPNKPFKAWMTGVSSLHALFTPARKGTFQFKTRLRKVGGLSTGYSPNLAITVQ